MRSAFFLLLCLAAPACTKGGTDAMIRNDLGADGAGSDAGTDMGGAACTTDTQCNDALDCTIDRCGSSLTCNHIDTCPSGMHCAAGGCTMALPGSCSSDAECDDHDACNGVETCVIGVHMCVPGRAMNCDDGDSCTTDGCAANHCTHTVICDSGVIGMDAPHVGPFDPATGYSGSFLMVPAANSGCGCATYTVNNITMSIVGGTLNVTTAPTPLGTFTQTPAPTGDVFSVSLTTSCGTYTISGTFSDMNTFNGNWSADFGGGLCPSQNNTIVGVRH